MDELAKAVQEKFERVWDPEGEGRYRHGSPGQRLAPRFAPYAPAGAIVNEYGSGTGRAVVALHKLRPDLKINMIDIAANALEQQATDLLSADITFRLGCLWDLPPDFPRADWGYCIDVLMCVPPEKLSTILPGIRRTCRNLFLQVYDWEDCRLGINYTTITEGPDWWEGQLAAVWPSVERLKSEEHARRYIFICGDQQGARHG